MWGPQQVGQGVWLMSAHWRRPCLPHRPHYGLKYHLLSCLDCCNVALLSLLSSRLAVSNPRPPRCSSKPSRTQMQSCSSPAQPKSLLKLQSFKVTLSFHSRTQRLHSPQPVSLTESLDSLQQLWFPHIFPVTLHSEFCCSISDPFCVGRNS